MNIIEHCLKMKAFWTLRLNSRCVTSTTGSWSRCARRGWNTWNQEAACRFTCLALVCPPASSPSKRSVRGLSQGLAYLRLQETWKTVGSFPPWAGERGRSPGTAEGPCWAHWSQCKWRQGRLREMWSNSRSYLSALTHLWPWQAHGTRIKHLSNWPTRAGPIQLT